jgi:hypothetical protein
MQLQAMQVLYHSQLCPDAIKREIVSDAARRGLIADRKAPFPKPRYFPALHNIDREQFLARIAKTEYGRYLDTIESPAQTLRVG